MKRKNYSLLIRNVAYSLLFAVLGFLSDSAFSQGAAVNTSGAIADPSAMLDVSSNNSGMLIPRMTTAERNAISNPADGLQIFNSTSKCLEIFISPSWQSVYCGCTQPIAPTPDNHSPFATEIIWNWNAVNGATGYKYNTVNDYQSATDNGNILSYSQSGLTCNTSYTLYVWAYNNCAHSPETQLNQVTLGCFSCGISTISFIYNGGQVNYGTVQGNYNGGYYCWLDRNLGASAVATAYNDINGYGDFFQWGRLDDGHQIETSLTTTTLSSTDIPGHSYFIVSSGGNVDWRNPQNNSLWQNVIGVNNPCPMGWRLPTETELYNERLVWVQYNYIGAISSALKLPAAGVRYTDGTVGLNGSYGFYWCSTVDGTKSRNLRISSGDAYCFSETRAYGRSVRCIKD